LILAVWRERGLQPWRTRSFRHSNDPFLVRKVHDVVSCYEAARRSRRPPIVLCVDEKPSIQAISRTAPILPMRPGQVEGRSADYIRHGTSDLYAAFNVASGEVFYRQTERHTSADFIGFLDQIVAACPIRRRIDIVLDNLRTHKTLLIDQWLALHPGVRFHFTPTHASWMNRVEVWFGTLERRCLRRSNTGSVAELRDLISLFISSWNQEAHPYKWFKTSEQILLKAMPR
jgi:transposase